MEKILSNFEIKVSEVIAKAYVKFDLVVRDCGKAKYSSPVGKYELEKDYYER